LVQIVRLLDQSNVGVESLAVREPTLDDVFLQLTGRPAADAVLTDTEISA
jgi:ABC-2 type transport system ATP-binding protein